MTPEEKIAELEKRLANPQLKAMHERYRAKLAELRGGAAQPAPSAPAPAPAPAPEPPSRLSAAATLAPEAVVPGIGSIGAALKGIGTKLGDTLAGEPLAGYERHGQRLEGVGSVGDEIAKASDSQQKGLRAAEEAYPGMALGLNIAGSFVPGSGQAVIAKAAQRAGALRGLPGFARMALQGGLAGGGIGAVQASEAGRDIGEGAVGGAAAGVALAPIAHGLSRSGGAAVEAFKDTTRQTGRGLDAIEKTGGKLETFRGARKTKPGGGTEPFMPEVKDESGIREHVSRPAAERIQGALSDERTAANDEWKASVGADAGKARVDTKAMVPIIDQALKANVSETGEVFRPELHRELEHAKRIVTETTPAKPGEMKEDYYTLEKKLVGAEPAKTLPRETLVSDLVKTRQALDDAAEWGQPQTKENKAIRDAAGMFRDLIGQGSPEIKAANAALKARYDKLQRANDLLVSSDETGVADRASVTRRISGKLANQIGSTGTAGENRSELGEVRSLFPQTRPDIDLPAAAQGKLGTEFGAGGASTFRQIAARNARVGVTRVGYPAARNLQETEPTRTAVRGNAIVEAARKKKERDRATK